MPGPMSLPRVRAPMLLIAGLAACTGGGGGEATEPSKAAETRDTLVIGSQADVGLLNPVVYQSVADAAVLEAISFPLVDVEFDCSLKKMPGFAKVWEWNEDGTVLKMELRDDLKWEDGVPVTAEDLKFTYDLVADPLVGSPRLANIDRMVPDARPKIIDATHIEWHYTQAYDRDTQMSQTMLGIVPKHVWEGVDRATLRGNDKINQPLSYGPWRVAKWEPTQRLVLEPNPNFSGPEAFKAHLDRVVFKILPDYSSRLIELEAGNIDMMEQVLVSDADRLREEHPEIDLVRRGYRSEDYLVWNLTNELFSDLRVRKALALATNVESMIEKLLTSKNGDSYARRSIGTITPALCGVHNDDVMPLPYDVEKAKALLAEAGWADSDHDGVLDKGGKKFEFTLITNAGNKRRADAGVLLKDMFAQVGVVANIEKIEPNAFFERNRKKEFEAALGAWSAGLFVDPTTVWHCDGPDKHYEFNFAGYCNPDVDALMEQGLSTPNPKDAAPIWKDVQARIYADQPYLFLWWLDEIVAVNNRFTNRKIDILSPISRLQEWEVPADKVKYERK